MIAKAKAVLRRGETRVAKLGEDIYIETFLRAVKAHGIERETSKQRFSSAHRESTFGICCYLLRTMGKSIHFLC